MCAVVPVCSVVEHVACLPAMPLCVCVSWCVTPCVCVLLCAPGCVCLGGVDVSVFLCCVTWWVFDSVNACLMPHVFGSMWACRLVWPSLGVTHK